MLNLTGKKILFLGIGGISMHQLALTGKNLGAHVFGYDRKNNQHTEKCKECGILVTNKFKKSFCSVDMCVVTPAIKSDNAYLKVLTETNCVILDRIEFLNMLCENFKCVIAVAGTHGKSTTATLIYEMLKADKKKVSCHIGADICQPRFNTEDDYLVVEACEYNKSFLKIHADITVITNVEAEHMDCYKSIYDLRSCFKKFLLHGGVRFVFKEKSTKFLTHNNNIEFVEKLDFKKTLLKGEYNKKNISLALAVCKYLKVRKSSIDKAIENFSGVPRRYEFLGKVEDTKVFIDYAHHPTEIKSFVTAFCNEGNTLIVFQPHTYSRTKTLLAGFLDCFKNMRNLVIFEEYSAREKKSQGLNAKDLYKEIKKANSNVRYWSKTTKAIDEVLKFDAVAFVGAGDINAVADKLVKTYEKKRLTKS